MRFIRYAFFTCLAFCLLAATAQAQTPVQKHGNLRISGKHIVDQKGAVTSLAGPSFFWSNTGWGQDRFYTRGAVETFARDWKAGIVRVAVGAQNNGSILKDRRGNLTRAQTVIEAAIDNGLYVIVDWHTHQAERDVAEAQAFFTHIAKRYGKTPNIIYEIYNEPLDTTDWNRTVKPYAETMIRTIRAVDPDNLIIVGTQTWSQDVDRAADNPIRGQKNILYALHFYAATHKDSLRQKAEYAMSKGLPIIISEWGTVTYSGDGYLDVDSTRQWMAFAKKHGLSQLSWAVSDKNESASMLRPGASSNGGWTARDLTPSGRLVRDVMRSW
ncbi:glycoside hydrolase family 5 protein [Hellea sp.]|nr:glycoside hydrolase family 5 protein [Hellea sp.]